MTGYKHRSAFLSSFAVAGLSIDMLKVYRKALDELIEELEGAKNERKSAAD